MVEVNSDWVFDELSKMCNKTDIRSVYTFIRKVGDCHLGTVRVASLKEDPDVLHIVKSVKRAKL